MRNEIEPELVLDLLQDSADVAVRLRLPARRGEHGIARAGPRRREPVGDQPPPQRGRDRNVPRPGVRLKLAARAVVGRELPAQADRRGVQVDVLPAQPERLAHASR